MSGIIMKYFVLKPRSKHKNDIYAKASRRAMQKYAETIKKENPIFAQELLSWAADEEGRAADPFAFPK